MNPSKQSDLTITVQHLECIGGPCFFIQQSIRHEGCGIQRAVTVMVLSKDTAMNLEKALQGMLDVIHPFVDMNALMSFLSSQQEFKDLKVNIETKKDGA